MPTVLRYVYSIFMMLITPFIFLRLYWRGAKAPAYRKRMCERFGYYSSAFKQNGILLHAVSVGELMAARPLITKIMQTYPDLALTITTTTPTGSMQVQKIYGSSVQHVYMPYDYKFVVKKFLNKLRPQLAIIMETEIWPNIFYQLQQQKIPLIIANARLSEKSFRNYEKLKFFFSPLLKAVTCIGAQSAIDAQRFEKLGVEREKILMMGNIKYDVKVQQEFIDKAQLLRSTFSNRKVWIAASTHTQEEDLIIQTALALKKQFPTLLSIIAPRHPERFLAIAQKCRAQGLRLARYSQHEKVNDDTDVLLADTLGELFLFYAASDVALVCGSFAPIGGHNILEPAALGLPIVVGPEMFHFKTILSDFLAQDALLQVDANGLLPALSKLLSHPATEMGQRALALVAANQGAVDKLWPQVASRVAPS